jgi:hypothetical protein
MRLLTLSLLLLLVACSSPPGQNPNDGGNGSDGGGSDGGTNANTDGGGSGDITGSSIHYFVDDQALPTPVTVDLSGATIAAYVYDPDAGTFQTFPGTVKNTNTFVIADAPAGERYLRINNDFIVTDQNSIDLSFSTLGRADATEVTQATDFVLNVSGMSYFQQDSTTGMFDDLELSSSNAGFVERRLPYPNSATGKTVTNAPLAGDTDLTNMTVDWAKFSRPVVVNGALGDTLRLTKVTALAVSEGQAAAVSDVFTAANSFALTPGQSNSLSGSFTAVSSTDALTATWKRSAFTRAG